MQRDSVGPLSTSALPFLSSERTSATRLQPVVNQHSANLPEREAGLSLPPPMENGDPPRGLTSACWTQQTLPVQTEAQQAALADMHPSARAPVLSYPSPRDYPVACSKSSVLDSDFWVIAAHGQKQSVQSGCVAVIVGIFVHVQCSWTHS